MNYKHLIFALAVSIFFSAQNVYAHVVVKPNSAGVGAFQAFSMGVPSEKNIPTVGVRLILPEGLNFVTPNVKPGWKIEIKTKSTGKKITNEDGLIVDEIIPSEIDWTGGLIPAGQRDEFLFQTQVPTTPTSLKWIAYQTYQDGSMVAWDQDPNNLQDGEPYSKTTIINDVSALETPDKGNTTNATAITVSLVALVFSLIAFTKKKS